MSQTISYTANAIQLTLGLLTQTSAPALITPRTLPLDRFTPSRPNPNPNPNRWEVALGPNALQSQLLTNQARSTPSVNTPAATTGARLFHPLQVRSNVTVPPRPSAAALATLRLHALPVGIR